MINDGFRIGQEKTNAILELRKLIFKVQCPEPEDKSRYKIGKRGKPCKVDRQDLIEKIREGLSNEEISEQFDGKIKPESIAVYRHKYKNEIKL